MQQEVRASPCVNNDISFNSNMATRRPPDTQAKFQQESARKHRLFTLFTKEKIPVLIPTSPLCISPRGGHGSGGPTGVPRS